MTIIQTGNESVTEFVIDNGNTTLIISFIFNMLIDIETIILLQSTNLDWFIV